jgi:hypothetical protein
VALFSIIASVPTLMVVVFASLLFQSGGGVLVLRSSQRDVRERPPSSANPLIIRSWSAST